MPLVPELAFDLEPTEDDRLLQAESLVRSYCGWHIAPSRTETVVVHTWGGTNLLLPSLHVTSVDAVTEGGTDLILDEGYAWLTPNSWINRYSWAWDTDVEVTFTHGFDDAPAEVTGVVQAVARRAVDNPGSYSQEAAGPFNNRRAGTGATLELLDAEKAILDRYRLPALA